MSGRVHEVSHLHKTRPNYLHIRAFRIYSEQTRSRQIFEHSSVPFSPVQTQKHFHTDPDLSGASSTYGLFREIFQLNKTFLTLSLYDEMYDDKIKLYY